MYNLTCLSVQRRVDLRAESARKLTMIDGQIGHLDFAKAALISWHSAPPITVSREQERCVNFITKYKACAIELIKKD